MILSKTHKNIKCTFQPYIFPNTPLQNDDAQTADYLLIHDRESGSTLNPKRYTQKILLNRKTTRFNYVCSYVTNSVIAYL